MLYDCIGIGVGPANLSLACLAQSHPELRAVFLEERSKLVWHGGMQLPDARIQVSHFKDLVTQADPTNNFTFVNFLKEKKRLYHFLNARFDAVLRTEFQEYLAWAFSKNPLIHPNQRVTAIRFDGNFDVSTETDRLSSRAIVIGAGQLPKLPDCLEGLSDPNMIHSAHYCNALPDPTGRSVCVIGGGQSGAEVFHDLISRRKAELPRQVVWVSRRPNFEPIDDSPFANELFTPHFSETYFNASRLGTGASSAGSRSTSRSGPIL